MVPVPDNILYPRPPTSQCQWDTFIRFFQTEVMALKTICDLSELIW